MNQLTTFYTQSTLVPREDGMAEAWPNGYTPFATVLQGREWMRIYADGTIERDIEGASNYGHRSFNWRVVGAVRLNNFGKEVERYSLEDVLYEELPWKFKNKRQQVHILDYDHGSICQWMNPDHMFWRMRRPNLLTPKLPWRNLIVCCQNTPVLISGPYAEFDFPYGKAISSTARRVWWVKWMTWKMVMPPDREDVVRDWGEDSRTPEPVFKEHIYRIINFNDQPDRYLVNGAYPAYEAASLDALIRRLVLSDEKPSRCS